MHTILRVTAGGCWAALTIATVKVCHSGLAEFPAPGLSEWPWVTWVLAAGLCGADAVLFLAWRNCRRWWYLLALVLLAAVSVSAEALNVARGLSNGAAAVTADAAAAAIIAADLEGYRQQMTAAAAAVDALMGTDRDGDAANDTQLPAAEAALKRAEAQYEARVDKSLESARAAAFRRSAVHPLVAPRWAIGAVTAGLVALRAVAVALAAVAHGAPEVVPEWQTVAHTLAGRKQARKRR